MPSLRIDPKSQRKCSKNWIYWSESIFTRDSDLIPQDTPGQILQRRLLALAAAFTILYAMILTFSPAMRYHSDSINLRWFHWLGVLIWLFCFVLLEQIS